MINNLSTLEFVFKKNSFVLGIDMRPYLLLPIKVIQNAIQLLILNIGYFQYIILCVMMLLFTERYYSILLDLFMLRDICKL